MVQGDVIAFNSASLHQQAVAQEFVLLTFKIKYKTEFGECLSIIGESETTGQWTDFGKGMMEWTEGHWWKITFEIDPKQPFMYKYVVLDHASRKPKHWEQGINRICDPQFIPRSSNFGNCLEPVIDEWEHFTVTFSIYMPTSNVVTQYMRINGQTEKLGDWNKGRGPIKMQIGASRRWLTGEIIQPWELKNVRFTHSQMPEKLVYKYSKYDSISDVTIWEREPSRELKILSPDQYKAYKRNLELAQGFAPSQSASESTVLEWRNVNEVFLVNGHIEKSDANFVGDLNFQKIGEERIFIGPYPMTEEDI